MSYCSSLINFKNFFNDFNTVGEDLFFVEYDGYIYDCIDINRLRQVK